MNLHLEGSPFFIICNVVSLVTILSFGGNKVPRLVQFVGNGSSINESLEKRFSHMNLVNKTLSY